MYRLLRSQKFDWSVVRYGGMINPYFTVNHKGTIRIHWVELQDAEGKVMGAWPGFQIPRETAAAIARVIQEEYRDWDYIPPSALVGMNWEPLS